jgi:hypothetical protein
MHGILRRQEIIEFVKAALECSVYLSPSDFGLTFPEIIEIGSRIGLQEGELGDALQGAAGPMHWGDTKYRPAPNPLWSQFLFREEPEYRNVAAFDFVCTELQSLGRSLGMAHARIDHSVLLARAVERGLPRADVEAAIQVMLLGEHFEADGETIRFARGRENYPLASEQLRQSSAGVQPAYVAARARAYPLVKDVISRRTDGRRTAAEPLDAFADHLERLGYKPFGLWWAQILSELRRSDTSTSPVSVAVLAAALVEGALTFVVRHARSLNKGVMGSKTFEGSARTWRIDDLVSSAASGQDSAILDPPTRQAAERLILTRQRIHAGRMLVDFPKGVPDLRPEEARDAKRTADAVVRRICDWLDRFPA